jgi:hypothetical protein
MRGLIEFIVIFGLIAVAVVVAIFSLQLIPTGPSIPSYVASEYTTIRDSIKNLVTTASRNVIIYIEKHGGYIFPELVGTTKFAGLDVPYWQFCDKDVAPSIEMIESSLSYWLKYFLNATIPSFGYDAEFDFDSLTTNATILEDKINLKYSLKMKIKNETITEPITVTIPTRFGRIYNFGKDYVAQAIKPADQGGRFWEIATIYALTFSDLPIFKISTDCGVETYSQAKISQELRNVALYVMQNMVLWRDSTTDTAYPKIFGIKEVNGKQYTDLDVKFLPSDDLAFPVFFPLIISNINPIVPLTDMCLSIHKQTFSIGYPVIVNVHDDLLDNDFLFTSYIFVDDSSGEMEPGECENIFAQAARCQGATANIVVGDGTAPLEGVLVQFGGCFVGKTDQNGMVSGDIPEGEFILTLYKEGYEAYQEKINSETLRGASFTLRPQPKYKFNFYQLKHTGYPDNFACETTAIDNESIILNFTSKRTGRSYTITALPQIETNPDCEKIYENFCTQCQDTKDEDACGQCAQRKSCWSIKAGPPTSKEIDYIPADDYYLNIIIINQAKAIQYPAYTQGIVSSIPIFLPNPDWSVSLPYEVSLPPHDAKIAVYVADTDPMYDILVWMPAADAPQDCGGLRFYEHWCDMGCITGELRKAAKAAAIGHTIEWLTGNEAFTIGYAWEHYCNNFQYMDCSICRLYQGVPRKFPIYSPYEFRSMVEKCGKKIVEEYVE